MSTRTTPPLGHPVIKQDKNTGKWYSTSGLFIYTGDRDTKAEVEADLRRLGWQDHQWSEES